MSSLLMKWLIPCLVVALILPGVVSAKGLGLSPHRAQLTTPDFEQAPTDETTAASPQGKKNIGRAVMFSLIIPGTGQLYSGSWLRAVPWFAIEVGAWALFAKYHGDGKDKTDQFEEFAGPWKNTDPNAGSFNYDVYFLREYQVAVNEAFARVQFEGDFAQWQGLTWEERSEHLPAPYTHDIATRDVQQYYEMIGKYYEQFGYGWNDTWDDAYTPGTETLDNIWLGAGDDPATVGFDGGSPLFFEYRDMRGEANDLLEKGNTMMEIVLVNHVLSALDAAFAVRSHNRKLESASLGSLDLRYDIKYRDGAMARTLTLSMPIPGLR